MIYKFLSFETNQSKYEIQDWQKSGHRYCKIYPFLTKLVQYVITASDRVDSGLL